MKVLCLLQNGWGSRGASVVFKPNPLNKSAKRLRKLIGEGIVMHFCNTTAHFTSHANQALPIDAKHVTHLIKCVMPSYDVLIVCGKQATKAVQGLHLPITHMLLKHPAARDFSNKDLEQYQKHFKTIVQ